MSEGQSSPENRPLIQTSKLPINNWLIESFDRSVEKNGLHEAATKFLAKLRYRVNTSYESPETLEVLREKPTLIIATHNKTRTETLPLVASLPPRNDIYIVGNACFLDYGKSFKEFVLPLYVSNKSAHGLSAKFLTITEFESGSPNPIENYKKNEPMIEEIIKRINEGHQIIVYPAGNRFGEKPRKGIWHNGIGHIILSLQKSTDAYIVMAKAGESLPRPNITAKKLSLFGIDINYFSPMKVSDFLNRFEPKNLNSQKITRALEEKYYGF